MSEPTPADTLTPDQIGADQAIATIRAELGTIRDDTPRSKDLQAQLEAQYKARYGDGPIAGSISKSPPAPKPRPSAPTPAQGREPEIRAQIDALRVKPYGVGESDLDRAEAIAELYRQLHAPTSDPAGDRVIAAAETELRDLKPGTPEWARTVDKLDAAVLRQPVTPADVETVQQAAEGIGLTVTPEEVQDLARVRNVIRYNLGPEAVDRVMVSGMAAIRRAHQAIEAGQAVNESWEDVAPELEREWGRDAERRVQDIREAWGKLPKALRATLTRDKRVIYHKGVLMFLADVGGKIPLGPPW